MLPRVAGETWVSPKTLFPRLLLKGSVGLAGFEPAAPGLKGRCSNLAELQALWKFLELKYKSFYLDLKTQFAAQASPITLMRQHPG